MKACVRDLLRRLPSPPSEADSLLHVARMLLKANTFKPSTEPTLKIRYLPPRVFWSGHELFYYGKPD